MAALNSLPQTPAPILAKRLADDEAKLKQQELFIKEKDATFAHLCDILVGENASREDRTDEMLVKVAGRMKRRYAELGLSINELQLQIARVKLECEKAFRNEYTYEAFYAAIVAALSEQGEAK